MLARFAAILLACCLLVVDGAPTRAGGPFSWEQSYAKILPKGDLEWTPMPFRFEKGASLRYIDFDAGNDANDGDTTQTPWKHHPWDSQDLATPNRSCNQRKRSIAWSHLESD